MPAQNLPLPFLFEENKGQTESGVKFLSRGANYDLFLFSNEIIYRLTGAGCPSDKNRLFPEKKKENKACTPAALSMRLAGANADPAIAGLEQAVTESGYFIGRDPDKWIRGIGNYRAVRYRDIYQGIDAVFRGSGQNMEYDFIVSPGTDSKQIVLEFSGTKKARIDGRGNLILKLGGFELVHRKPFAYQMIDGRRREVQVSYDMLGRSRVGFSVGKYDPDRELVIDPVVYASYLGGTVGGDSVNDIAVDRGGYIYTASDERTLVTPNESYSNVVVMKFSPEGGAPIYRHSYGGAVDDAPLGIDVDADGRVYLTGVTWSTDFPLRFADQSAHSINVVQTDYMAFVMRLYGDGQVDYSTFLGGPCSWTFTQNRAERISADSGGNAYVTGYTCSSAFPVRNAFQTSLGAAFNGFLTKYNSFGQMVYSTYIGGSGDTYAADVATDGQGGAYVTGNNRGGLSTTAGAFKTSGLGFAARYDTNKSGAQSLVYSTYLETPGTGIEVDPSGSAWIGTRSGYCGIGCGVSPKLFKLNGGGTALLLAPIAISNSGDEVWDIAADVGGNLFYIESESSGLKAVGRRPDGSLIEKSGFDTGTGRTRVWAVAAGPQPGMMYIAGRTTSMNFPTTPDAYQPYSKSPSIFLAQGFYAKFQMGVPEERNPLIFIPGIGGSTLYEADDDNNPIHNLWMDGLTQVTPYPTEKLSKLSLKPSDAPFSRIVPGDAVRDLRINDLNIFEVYGEFLKSLTTLGGYISTVGCPTQPSGESPTLFIFPYDWRLSNADSAAKLRDLIACIQSHHPTRKVNILTHSMGGLVARRYIIDHPNNHNINKWVSMVAPWLGAAKALDAIHTGRFVGKFETGGGVYLYQNSVKNIVQYGAGPHELLPSAWYFINGGRPYAYQGLFDQRPKEYSYTETFELINLEFPSRPYENTADFHNEAGQDNWASDISGIKYHHFYGEQKCSNTIGQFIVRPRTSYPISVRKLRFGSENKYVKGDGTVPTISADRPSSMLAPNSTVRPFRSPKCSEDDKYDHNGILGNAQFRAAVFELLNESSGEQILTEELSKTIVSATESFNPEDLMNYLSVAGVDRLTIADAEGNTNTSLGNADRGIRGISYEYGSNSADLLEVPHEVSFSSGKTVDVKFQTSADNLKIVNIKGFGRENATEVIKYLDLQLPAGINAWIKFSANGLEGLYYDADSDGIFETQVPPTFYLTGDAAKDNAAPIVDILFSVSDNSGMVTVNAADAETGVNQIRYIINGDLTDRVYNNSPFSIDLTQSKLVYVSAEDNAGNRSLSAKWLDISAPDTTITQTIASNQNGWNKENVTVNIKSIDDLGGSGVESLTFSGNGAQLFPEESIFDKRSHYSFPSPSAATDSLTKNISVSSEGITNFSFFGRDRAGNVEPVKAFTVKIDKTSPQTTGSLTENGSQMTVALDSTDTISGIERVEFSVDGGDMQNYSAPFTVSGNGSHTILFFGIDKAGNVEQAKTLTFTIVNPDVTITSPSSGEIHPVGTTVSFSGSFSEDSCGQHSSVWKFNEITITGQVDESTREVTARHAFTSAGVYFIKLTVNNICGGSGTSGTVDGLPAMVVVYDPAGDFVTGGGWFDSPAGAYRLNPNLSGKMSFGFNAKYQRDINVPTGNADLQFRIADFNFKSTDYDWLVVGGARAQIKGSGKINNAGNFGFLLTATDGQPSDGTDPDRFRIKIWDKNTGDVIYDNQPGISDNESPTSIIGGGSIIIHRQ